MMVSGRGGNVGRMLVDATHAVERPAPAPSRGRSIGTVST